MSVVLDAHSSWFHVVVLEDEGRPVLPLNIACLDVDRRLMPPIAGGHEVSPVAGS